MLLRNEGVWEELEALVGGGAASPADCGKCENAHKAKRAIITDQVQEVKVSQRLN